MLAITTGMRPGRRDQFEGEVRVEWEIYANGVESEKPILLLLIPDINHTFFSHSVPNSSLALQKNLNFHSVWGVLCDQMKTPGFFDRCRRLISIESSVWR